MEENALCANEQLEYPFKFVLYAIAELLNSLEQASLLYFSFSKKE